jgi:hypothetical protein
MMAKKTLALALQARFHQQMPHFNQEYYYLKTFVEE